METREYKFYQHTDVDRDIICDVLDKWCVPYKVVRRKIDCFPYPPQEEFDIVVNLTDEKWCWIRQLVWDRLEHMNNLEECYDMETVEHPDKDQDAEPFKGKLGLRDLFNRMEKIAPTMDTKDMGGIATIEIGHIPNPNNMLDSIMDKIRNIAKGNEPLGKEVQYTDIPKDIRKDILKNVPIIDVITGRAKIYQTKTGYIVKVGN